MKWNKFVSGLDKATARFFDEVAEAGPSSNTPSSKAEKASSASGSESELVTRLQKTIANDRRGQLQTHLTGLLCKILGRDSLSAADTSRGFMDLGLDSLMGVEFRNRLKKELGEKLGKALPPTLVFDYPNLAALTDFLMKEVLKDVLTATGAGDAKDGAKSAAGKARKKVSDNEPIAIVGAACRLPGGIVDLEGYWKVLSEGLDMIGEVPKERWDIDAFFDADPEAPGKMVSRYGGFLKNVSDFDAEFFEISAREASEIDPQQRLLLETAWEALESAAIDPMSLRGSRTGVFLGVGNYDYGRLHVAYRQRDLSGYFGIGTLPPAMAGRISFFFGFQGPCFVLDTACSGSLLAIHQACHSLRSGESDMMLAGGINLMLSPDISISFSHAHMLSPSGRCKTFDESADGYVRAEGCGVVVLKRLSDALANNDPIMALVRGTSSNQDGRSGSLTAPNGPSQEALLKESLANAGLQPADVSYFEAHGTGTPLGDPIEVYAAGKVLREGRESDNPLLMGSHKTNIGHAEAAAGVAGVLKLALALKHRQIPPHLHFKNLNSKISLEDIPARIPVQLEAWEPKNGRRIATVSSYGFTGSNVNAIIEEAPQPKLVKKSGECERPLHLLCLSAKSTAALKEVARRYLDWIQRDKDLSIADVCFTAAVGRTHFEERLAVMASDRDQLLQKLNSFVQGDSVVGLWQGRVSAEGIGKIAFLFSGQGSQYAEMGKALYESQPSFKKAIDQCAQFIDDQLDRSLHVLLFDPNSAQVIDETRYTQVALFSLEYALAQMWKGWGVEPAAVLGHSVGELVAACVAGVFPLDEALKLTILRARLMGSQPGEGGMAVVNADLDVVAAALKPYAERLSVAALNGPGNTVVSGYLKELNQLIDDFGKKDIKCKRLSVSHGFHSPQMQGALAELDAAVANINRQAPQIRLISNLTGKAASDEFLDAKYFSRHVREAVHFAAGVQSLYDDGCRLFLEIGPGTALSGMAQSVLSEHEDAHFVPSLKKGLEDWKQLLETIGQIYCLGGQLDWHGFEADTPARRKLSGPTYPFQRKRLWLEGSTLAPAIRVESLVPSTDTLASDVNAPAAIAVSVELRKLSLAKRTPQVQSFIQAQLQSLLGMDGGGSIDVRKNLGTIGMDSLMVIRLRSILNKSLQLDLPKNVVNEYPTLEKLSAFVSEQLSGPQVAKDSPKSSTSAWTVCQRPIANPKLRLFCFPFAGGSAQAFANWSSSLPTDVEVHAVQLPGRMGRLDESAPSELADLVAKVVQGLKPLLEIPYAFVGYSFGGLLAFEVLQELQRQGHAAPLHFYPMASAAPGAWRGHRDLHKLPDDKFVAALSERYNYQGLATAFADKDLAEVLLPVLRSEIRMVESYQPKRPVPLDCGVTPYFGERDGVIGEESVTAWKALAHVPFNVRRFSTGHFFMQTEEKALLAQLSADLRQLLEAHYNKPGVRPATKQTKRNVV